MEEEYKWRKKWRIEPSIDVEHEPEKTAIGWDVKITPEGKPKIIEYHERDFGTKGFSEAFRYGDVEDSLEEYREKKFVLHEKYRPLVREFADRGFPNYLVKHERKDRTQEVLGQFMPRRLSEGQAEVLENVILVSKPRDGGVGRGVEVADNPEELPYQEESLHADITNEGIEIFKTEEDRILERFLESKDIELDKKPSEWIGDNFKPSYQFATAAIAGFALQALTAYALGDPIVGEGVNLSNAEAYEWLYGITGGLLEGDAVFRWGTGCSMLGKLGGLADTVYYKVTGKQFVETRAYDGCMRHVTAIEVVEDGLIVEDFGGYWRTAEEPKDADVDDLNKKYLANLSAGNPVEASDEELIKAQNIAVEAVSELYRSWLENEKGLEGVEIGIEEI